MLVTHRGRCSLRLGLSFFHFIPQLIATAHLRRSRPKVTWSAPGGTVRAGLSWTKPASAAPQGAQEPPRSPGQCPQALTWDKEAPLLALWEILDCFRQQTAPRCWAAKFPPSVGSWGLNLIPSPNEKHSLKMPGHQGGRPHRAQVLAASPVTGLAYGGTRSATEPAAFPIWGRFQATLLMSHQTQLTAVT